MTEEERTFYRKLFLKRYAMLLKKVEQVYTPSEDQLQTLQAKFLSLDWIDSAIDAIPSAHTSIDINNCTHDCQT